MIIFDEVEDHLSVLTRSSRSGRAGHLGYFASKNPGVADGLWPVWVIPAAKAKETNIR
jgi:hypothetical protein